MKDKIILFIIGVLVGAIISTGAFYVYTTTTKTTDTGYSNMQMDGQQPPSMPGGQSSENGQQPPSMPSGQNSQQTSSGNSAQKTTQSTTQTTTQSNSK